MSKSSHSSRLLRTVFLPLFLLQKTFIQWKMEGLGYYIRRQLLSYMQIEHYPCIENIYSFYKICICGSKFAISQFNKEFISVFCN